jgi:predicted signal transduction protein with EAL and GGDEF domain
VLELELARGRQGGDVSVAVFDVDGFTALNAAGGRAAGDAVCDGSPRCWAAGAPGRHHRRSGADESRRRRLDRPAGIVAQRIIDGVGGRRKRRTARASLSRGRGHFPADGTTADDLLGAARGPRRSAGGRPEAG